MMSSLQHRVSRLPSFAGDAALTLLAAGFALVTFLGRSHGPRHVSHWALPLALLCALSLLPRGRWPVASLLMVGATGALYLVVSDNQTFAILPTVFIALYSAVAYSGVPRLKIWTLALGVCVLLNTLNLLTAHAGHPEPPGGRFLPPPPGVRDSGIPEDVSTLMFDSAWMLTALLLGEAMRGRRAYAQEAELRAVQAEQTRHEMAQRRVVEERLQIARELHDIMAHTVALINVQAGVAAHVIDKQPEQAREALNNIKEASRATLQELRALVGVLRESGDGAAPRAPTPGLDALDGLVNTVRDAGLAVDLDVSRPNGPLPATVDVAAYRILQEALTNVIKHAGSVPVHVSVRQDGSRLTLDVTNNANGATAAMRGEGSGHGIPGMRERAAALGGTLQAGPLPGGGFHVHATLPVPGGTT
jgi:signal transduction histidine kinase